MADNSPPGHKPDYKEIIQALTELGARLGTDALIFSLVLVGTYVAVWKGVDPTISIFGGISLLLVWLANKVLNAYHEKRQAEDRLRELKAKEGKIVLGKHRRKQVLPSRAPKKPRS